MLNTFTAQQARSALSKQQLSATELVQSCLHRIQQREPTIGAWESLDPDRVLQQAKDVDAAMTQSPAGLLQGIPVGVKDIFATVDYPTGWGTPIHAGKGLGYDAAVVERLRSAGAIIMGKTVTTEYATARAGKTRNPHHPEHTPGGSSSGSAAAVADGMVPLAIGSQTLGSILRPAAYCGIYGFKPSFGMISRYGALPCSRELDHVGVFARSIPDIALLCQVLSGVDQRDPDCYGTLSLSGLENISATDRPPKLALILTAYEAMLEPNAKAVLLDSAMQMVAAGAVIEEVTLPDLFQDYFQQAMVLSAVGMAVHHGHDYDQQAEQMSPKLREVIEWGRSISGLVYGTVRQTVTQYSLVLADLFEQYDAILTPVTTGTAPPDLNNTGSPIFCALWTLCGLPAITLPIQATDRLPLGIQLVGKRTGDRKLLAIAAWVAEVMNIKSTIALG